MTLTRFVTKSAFRNKRRSILTVLSITFSLLLLTVMMTVWHRFYINQSDAQSAQRLITRHRVSLTQNMPVYYREKMRTLPGVVAVAPTQWFGGFYKDEKPENFFAQFGTDPAEIFKVMTDFKIPDDQLAAWEHDQAGCVADSELAKKFGWKIGGSHRSQRNHLPREFGTHDSRNLHRATAQHHGLLQPEVCRGGSFLGQRPFWHF